MADELNDSATFLKSRRNVPVVLRWILFLIPWAVVFSLAIRGYWLFQAFWLFPNGLFYFIALTPPEGSWTVVFAVAEFSIGWTLYILLAIFLLRVGSIPRFITLYTVFLALLAYNWFGWIRLIEMIPFRQ
jgi:hypothetical protein